MQIDAFSMIFRLQLYVYAMFLIAPCTLYGVKLHLVLLQLGQNAELFTAFHMETTSCI